MELFKGFITTLVTTLIFITAVELIGPNNSMKKYLKFVMGLILIAVLLSPIVKFFTSGEEAITSMIDDYTQEGIDGYVSEESVSNYDKVRVESFKDNINKNIVSSLEKEFKDKKFESSLDCDVDFNEMIVKVNEVKIGVQDNGVKSVQPVNIGGNNTEEKKVQDDEIAKKIKEFVSEELEISKDKITIYYL